MQGLLTQHPVEITFISAIESLGRWIIYLPGTRENNMNNEQKKVHTKPNDPEGI